MQVSPVSNSAFKGRINDSKALQRITNNADKNTNFAFNNLVKRVENINDNMLFSFDIGKTKYKMLADSIQQITDYILTKINLETGEKSTFTIEEKLGSFGPVETPEKRYSDILNIFIKHFNEEVYPLKETKQTNKYNEIIKDSILGESK